MAARRDYGGSFICPSCGLPRKRKKYPLTSTCRWCRWPKRRTHGDGYIDLWKPEHPLARADGYVSEHRFVLHEAGVEIPPGAHVHHVNGVKDDNRIENLTVLSPADHTNEHIGAGDVVPNQYGGHARWRTSHYVCPSCGSSFRPHVRKQIHCSRGCVKNVKNQYGTFPRH